MTWVWLCLNCIYTCIFSAKKICKKEATQDWCDDINIKAFHVNIFRKNSIPFDTYSITLCQRSNINFLSIKSCSPSGHSVLWKILCKEMRIIKLFFRRAADNTVSQFTMVGIHRRPSEWQKKNEKKVEIRVTDCISIKIETKLNFREEEKKNTVSMQEHV